MSQSQDIIVMQGGMDLHTPSMQKPKGSMIACENYEVVEEGYHRCDGYERFDGQPKPSEALPHQIDFDAGSTEPSVGDQITGATSGAAGFLLEAITLDSGTWGGGDAAGTMVLRNVTGTFQDDEALQVSAVTHATADGTSQAPVGDDETELATYLKSARDAARAEIGSIPGSGAVRGVVRYMGDVYGFRDNAGATACVMHKATAAGWVAQDLGHILDFTTGTATFQEDETVTGGTSGATATIKRIVVTSGTFAGNDAAGYLVLSGITGVFTSETITGATSAGSATSSGSQTANSLPAGGKYRFQVHNFYGASNLRRLYGVNGVGKGFEWDGVVFAPISTRVETALDKPKHIAVQRNHLLLAYDGGYVMHSGVGLPLSYAVDDGAGEFALGHDITNMKPSTKNSVIFTMRDRVSYLIGSSSLDFDVKDVSEESGAIEDTLQIVGQAVFLDDKGLREMSAVQAFGDWKIASLSRKVQKLLAGNIKAGITPIGSMRVKGKDQYRLFFSDNSGFSFYFGRKEIEPTRFLLGFTPSCFYSGEDDAGNEVLFAGGDDGYVYQMDSGTSQDGGTLTAFFRLAFAHQGAPNQDKRYHRGRIEMDAGSGPVDLGVVSNTAYGDPDNIGGQEVTYSVAGGGGFWDEFLWDEFYWSAAVQQIVQFDIDDLGQNISVTVLSDLAEEEPHTISTLTIFYTARRILR